MANDSIQPTTLTVWDQKFEVHIDPHGACSAAHAGHTYREATLEDLRKRLLDATRPSFVSVAISATFKVTLRDGVIVGIQHGSNQFLISWEDQTGTKQECLSYYDCLQRLSIKEQIEVFRRMEVKARAEQELYEFISLRLFPPREVVNEAVETKINDRAVEQKE